MQHYLQYSTPFYFGNAACSDCRGVHTCLVQCRNYLQCYIPCCTLILFFLSIFLFSGEFSRQINDFKIKLQKAEQDNARLEGLVARLESQVKRYKTQAEAAEATEDSLKAEKRKLQRELRKAQDEIGELQTVNDHLQKRFDKLKSKRKDDT